MGGDIKQEGGLPFEEALVAKPHVDSYRTSLAYYMLTGRKGSKVYTDGQAYVVVSKHPHIEDRLLLFPEINGNGSLSLRILSDMVIPKNGIQLARYSQEDLNQLQLAARYTPSNMKVDLIQMDETIMDWEYPVHILDTSITAALEGKSFQQVRTKFNGVADRLTIIPLDAEDAIRSMRAAVMFWAGAMIYAGKESGHSLTELYDVLIKMIQLKPEMFNGFVTMDGKEPAGFTIWDKPVDGTVNAIAGLSRRSIKGMSEFQTITACRILEKEGIRGYNMGGSETSELDHHKRKYLPRTSLKLSSYDVRIQNMLTAGVSELALPTL